ncbi:MAG: restriction endonuclease subunit S [Deltaproteobacteria bacterium]|nr:restriction endonuclease subunit S [Desulfitobacteriaceae bacterium]MDI6854628.1 restriction endonuclease subunit S [Deltaproteobacteria bacterium]
MSKLMVGPIKDFALGIFDGPHATPKESEEGPVFLGIKNVTPDGRLDFSQIRHVSEQEFPKWTRRVTPQADDIVFSYEATLHRYALIPEDFRGCLGRRMALIRPNQEKVHPRYIHYYFLTPQWRALIEANIVSGATVDRIPIRKFPEYEIRLPERTIQATIASTLSAYDDLIENNRRRIQLLDEAARLLYKEWFVRLRFPGHEHVKIKNGVPEGWVQVPLSQMCIDVRQQVYPSKIEPDTPYVGLEHIPRRSITLQEWGKASDVESSKFAFNSGDILFGKIRPYFHKVVFAITDGITSSDAIVIRPAENWLYEYILFLISSDEFVALASKTVKEGSKMPRADWKFLSSYPFLRPPQEIAFAFSDSTRAIIAQLRVLVIQNRKLAKARDLLLPRLMNGEITV